MSAYQGRIFKPEEILTNDKAVMPTDFEHEVAYGRMLEEIYEWMWEHLWSCNKAEEGLTPEWVGGTIFEVVTEYDDRVDYSNKSLFESAGATAESPITKKGKEIDL